MKDSSFKYKFKSIGNIVSYCVIFLIAFSFTSCKDDLAYSNSSDDDNLISHTELEIPIAASLSLERTRSVDFSNNTSVAIRSLWIGVFDIQTGEIVGHKIEEIGMNVKAGADYVSQTVKVSIMYYDKHPEVRIVGVANFDEIIMDEGHSTDKGHSTLQECLENVNNWEEFTKVYIPLENLNDFHSNKSPLLSGYFYTETGSGSFLAQIDPKNNSVVTTDEDSKTKVNVMPEDEKNKNTDPDYSKMPTKLNGKLILRRLISDINVNIKPGENIEVSNVSYRRLNMPKSIYVAERKADTDAPNYTSSDIEKWLSLSANHADTRLEIDNGRVTDSSKAYENDKEFISGNIIASDKGYSFNFQHYENKHWGNASNYNAREVKEILSDGSKGTAYTALCATGTDFNKFASAFEINMIVKDLRENKTANVTYTIHEGYCNNEYGVKNEENPNDFGCIRNTSYTYNITVNGFKSISTNVTTSEHRDDISGSSWNYTNAELLEENDYPNTIETDKNSYIYHLTNLPEKSKLSAIRLYDINNEGNKDYIINDDALNGLSLPWLTAGNKAEGATLEKIKKSFTFFDKDGNTIGDVDKFYDSDAQEVYIKIQLDDESTYKTPDSFRKILYLVYLGDDTTFDTDGCTVTNSTLYECNCIPLDRREDIGEIIPVYHNQNISNWSYNRWDGAQNTISTIKWDNTNIKSSNAVYTIYIDEVEYSKITEDQIEGNTIIRFVNTANLTSGTHSVKILVADKEEMYKPSTNIFTNKLNIENSDWKFNDVRWSYLLPANNPVVCELVGLTIASPSKNVQHQSNNTRLNFGGYGTVEPNQDLERCCYFFAAKSGKLTLWGSSSGGSASQDQRFFNIKCGIDDNDPQQLEAGKYGTSTNGTNLGTININISEPTKIYIYPTNNLTIYEIKYE